MRQNGTSAKGRDPVIMAVLDQIFEVSQVDPAVILPDHYLIRDLGLDRVQVQRIMAGSAKALGINVPFENCRLDETTPKQMVDILRSWMWSSGQRAA